MTHTIAIALVLLPLAVFAASIMEFEELWFQAATAGSGAPSVQPLLWLDWSAPAGVTNGQYLYSNADAGTAGLSFTNNVAASTPVWVANQQNGLGGAYFDGVNDVLYTTNSTAALIPLHSTTTTTYIAMSLRTKSAAEQIIFINNNYGSASVGTTLAVDPNVTSLTHYVSRGIAGAAPILNTTTGSAKFVTNTWTIVKVKSDPRNSTARNRSGITIRGFQAWANAQTSTATNAPATYDLTIGANFNISYDLFGAIGEIKIYGSDLDASAEAAEDAAFATKWGL